MLCIIVLFISQTRPPPPLPHLHLSEEMVNDAAALLRNHINMFLSVSEDIALGKDTQMYTKVAACLLIMSVIGGMIDFLSLGYISKSYSCFFTSLLVMQD